jgi:hypothetical protein
VQSFVDAFGVTFPVLLDDIGWVFVAYRLPFGACTSPFPLDFIIDQQGIIRFWKCEYDPVSLIAGIDELLAAGTGVAGDTRTPSVTLRLEPNWPNPFNPFTRIAYELPHRGQVQLAIYDHGGRVVRLLEHGRRPAGRHVILWDGRNDRGQAMPSGVYLYRLTGPGGTAARKLTLVR